MEGCTSIFKYVRTTPLRVTLSMVSTLAITFACHAADATQDSGSSAQPTETSQQSGAEVSDSLDELLGDTGSAPAQPSQESSEPAQTPTAEAANGNDALVPAPDAATLSTIPVNVPDANSVADQPKKQYTAQIEEIIVTATKREESLREIPQSITAFSGDALEKSAIQSADQIVRMSPGVNLMDGGQQAAHITIRGISSGQDANQTTGTIYGNVSLTDPYLQLVTLDPNPFDLKSVEILKGPQGTLFGAGGFGGAIRYVPAPPVFGVWETKYFAEYTSVNESDKGAPIFGAALNVPIGTDDTVAMRLVGIQRRDPGYYDDTSRNLKDINKLEQTGLRGALAWKPNDAWDIKLLYIYQTMSADDYGFADNTEGRLSRGTTPIASPTDNKFQLGNFSVNYAFDWATVTSDTAVIKKSVIFEKDQTRVLDPGNLLTMLGITGLQIDTVNETKTATQEFRLTSPTDSDSPWKWATGVFGSTEDYHAVIVVPATGPLLPISLPPLTDAILTPDGRIILGTLNVDAKVQELALFGELTRQLGDNWSLSLGARAYRTSSGGTVNNVGIAFTGVDPTNGTVVEKGVSPKVSLTWKSTEDIMSYATVSRGYRVGGVQPGIVTIVAAGDAPKFFKSDSLMNYEVGLRTTWLENTLHADLAAYYLDWSNPQTRVFSSKDGLSNYFTNVGKVAGKGIEGSIEWLPPIEGVALTFGASYNKTVTSVPFKLSDSETVPTGTPFPQSPTWQTATTLAYAPDVGDWKPSIALTHTYLSKAINDLSTKLSIFGYQQFDLNLSLINPTLAWLPSISVIGTNILDERGITYRNGSAAGSATANFVDTVYTRPRAITVRISGKF
ncbi:TonB-dependent receptor [Stenotrophobium rhamnosiphilum]|uniref:TonB-dependent receptor n=1 Tax=Stenotrophobium rhamnosiphilum TaxID=2029166 RepID=A0A2T5MH18_9GAMM|nr:TonB-dependent receptor [Stenotrophobium rhamnosiphilum]PTU31853.1 hypothetical protein CJD38_03985 [Stenotrophobium rhamnosiphilum]